MITRFLSATAFLVLAAQASGLEFETFKFQAPDGCRDHRCTFEHAWKQYAAWHRRMSAEASCASMQVRPWWLAPHAQLNFYASAPGCRSWCGGRGRDSGTACWP